jgi:hypothetical protein
VRIVIEHAQQPAVQAMVSPTTGFMQMAAKKAAQGPKF